MTNPGETWLLWRDGAHSAVANMARDEALLDHCGESGHCCLRIYEWAQPSVSIGCFQHRAILPADRPGVRRLTGGGLVEHGHDVTYAIVAPKGHWLEQYDREGSYALIHEAVAEALACFSVDSAQTPEKTARTVDRATMACFAEPSRYDLLGAAGKLAGAAQRRTARGMLHQGSIKPPDAVDPAAVADALPAAVADRLGCRWRAFEPPGTLLNRANRLAAERYGHPSWQERR